MSRLNEPSRRYLFNDGPLPASLRSMVHDDNSSGHFRAPPLPDDPLSFEADSFALPRSIGGGGSANDGFSGLDAIATPVVESVDGVEDAGSVHTHRRGRSGDASSMTVAPPSDAQPTPQRRGPVALPDTTDAPQRALPSEHGSSARHGHVGVASATTSTRRRRRSRSNGNPQVKTKRRPQPLQQDHSVRPWPRYLLLGVSLPLFLTTCLCVCLSVAVGVSSLHPTRRDLGPRAATTGRLEQHTPFLAS